jgi:site-specific DNA-methyltransferase (adenine-specific)
MRNEKITWMPLQDLKPYEKNPRVISEKAINAVVESIREFGFKNPILVTADKVIIAGHTRRLAAEKLGLETVPVIVCDDLSEQQIQALRLADNKTAEFSEWDSELLEAELLEVTDLDMELFGFDSPDYNSDVEVSEDDFDEESDEIKSRVQTGEIWVLGEHRLMCGDSSNMEDVSKLMGGG